MKSSYCARCDKSSCPAKRVCVCVCVCLHLANIGSVKGADKEFVVCTVDGVAALECDNVAIGREARKKLFGGLHLCVCVCVCVNIYVCGHRGRWSHRPGCSTL